MTSPELLKILQKEKLRRSMEKSFYTFVQQAWTIIEPGTPFIGNWHLEEVCRHLEGVHAEEILRLLINVPPRSSKSSIASVLFNAWEWTTQPYQKYLTASYSSTLTVRDNIKTRRLVESDWYRSFWGDSFKLTGDQNQKTRFENDKTGYRIASSVSGGLTGDGGSRIIIDDPLSASQASSDIERPACISWFRNTVSTRLNNPKRDAMVVIMQRLHYEDLSGYILDQGGWEHLCLPMEYDGEKRFTSLGMYDKRIKGGELLWPERFGAKEIDNLKSSLGTYGYAQQMQQTPTPASGGMIQRGWFVPLVKKDIEFKFIIQSYDCAYTEKTSGDPTACVVLGVYEDKGRNYVLILDTWAEHLGYPDLRRKVSEDWELSYKIGTAKKHTDIILIEDKSSGISLQQDLKRLGLSIRTYNPGRADKTTRLHRVAPIIEAGLVHVVVDKRGVPLTEAMDLIDECAKFPMGKHDDRLDAMTQALIYLQDSGMLKLVEDYKEVVNPYMSRDRVNPYAV